MIGDGSRSAAHWWGRLAWLALPAWLLLTGFLLAAAVNDCLQETGALETPIGSRERSACWSAGSLLRALLTWGTPPALAELWLMGTVLLAVHAVVVWRASRRQDRSAAGRDDSGRSR